MVDEAISFHNPLFSVDAPTGGRKFQNLFKKHVRADKGLPATILPHPQYGPSPARYLMVIQITYAEVVMDDEAKNKCAHPNCTCKTAADSKFCSPYCESAKSSTAISCECGHAGCGGQLTG